MNPSIEVAASAAPSALARFAIKEMIAAIRLGCEGDGAA